MEYPDRVASCRPRQAAGGQKAANDSVKKCAFSVALVWYRLPFALRIANTSHVRQDVIDGFHHAVVLNTVKKKAWILRTGGFVGVYKWYGPVDVTTTSLDNCQLEHVSGLVQSQKKN